MFVSFGTGFYERVYDGDVDFDLSIFQFYPYTCAMFHIRTDHNVPGSKMSSCESISRNYYFNI